RGVPGAPAARPDPRARIREPGGARGDALGPALPASAAAAGLRPRPGRAALPWRRRRPGLRRRRGARSEHAERARLRVQHDMTGALDHVTQAALPVALGLLSLALA